MRRMHRAIGIVVLGTAVFFAGVLWWVASRGAAAAGREPTDVVLLDRWQVWYDNGVPSVTVLAIAVGCALVFAGAVVMIEDRVVTRSRRSEQAVETPLAPKIVMASTRGAYAGPVTITVLIPAHNEEGRIRATLAALFEQTRRPERVVVVADNCTDFTVNIARAWGVEVIKTVDNQLKKAGALNQALAQVLPGLGDNDAVLVMDADTMLATDFIETAVRQMTDDRALMAVGGQFYGEEGAGLIGVFQRNEYLRYARDIRRRRGRVFVLTGTASVFRPRGLRTVAAERGRLLPGRRGDVFDTVALTEDNELTLALKSLGALVTSPARCAVVTEVMPTWRALWAQRVRWQRGGLENLAAYGMRPQTFRYWAQQLGISYSVLALGAYVALMVLMAVSMDQWIWFPFWLGMGVLFTIERVVTVWRGGWHSRALAALVLPELLYAGFLSVVYVKGAVDIALKRTPRWEHVVGPGHPLGLGG